MAREIELRALLTDDDSLGGVYVGTELVSLVVAKTNPLTGNVEITAGGEPVFVTPYVTLAAAMSGRASIRRLAVWGDSVAAQNAIQSGGTSYLGGAFVPQALYMSGNRMDLVAVGGNSSMRTDEIISTYAAQIAPSTPDAVLLSVATNDLTQSLGADYAINGVSGMARVVEYAGAVPILMTIGAGELFAADPARLADWLQFNSALRALALQNDWPLFDAALAYVDPSSPVYAPLPGHTDGSVHPRNQGATALAESLAEMLKTLPRRQLAEPQDSSGNVCASVLLAGTGGTMQAGATGASPASTTFQKSSGTGASIVSSIIPRTDGGPGNWWQIDLSNTNANSAGFTLNLPVKTLAEAGVSAGAVLRFLTDVEVDAGHFGVVSVNLRLRFLGGSPEWVYSHQPESANGLLRTGAFRAQLRTPDFEIPVGTTAIALTVGVTGIGSTAGKIVMRAGNPSCTVVA